MPRRIAGEALGVFYFVRLFSKSDLILQTTTHCQSAHEKSPSLHSRSIADPKQSYQSSIGSTPILREESPTDKCYQEILRLRISLENSVISEVQGDGKPPLLSIAEQALPITTHDIDRKIR